MKILFLLYTRLLKQKFVHFYAGDQGIFTILSAFAAMPLLMLTVGTIDLSQMAAFENQMVNAAMIGMRAGGENYGGKSAAEIKSIIAQNMQPYPSVDRPSGSTGYTADVQTSSQRVPDTTVPDGSSFGFKYDTTVTMKGYYKRIQNLKNLFSQDGGQITINKRFIGTKYLPPVEIAIVADTTKFIAPGTSDLKNAGIYVNYVLQDSGFDTFINKSLKGRSIRIMIVPYSSTVKVNYYLLGKLPQIQYLNRGKDNGKKAVPGNVNSGSQASGQCLTETWNANQDVSDLPDGIKTYQNYYLYGCSNANAISGCHPANNEYKPSYTAYDADTWSNPDAQDSIWLNYNCPGSGLTPLAPFNSFAYFLIKYASYLTIPTIKNRSSLTKPLPHVGLLWAVRYLNNPSIWDTGGNISSKDPRTRKLIFLVTADAPLRQVPLADIFWNVQEYMHLRGATGKKTADVIGKGALLDKTYTPTNIDFYGALGYTNEIDLQFINGVTDTLNKSKNLKNSDRYKDAVNEYSYMTGDAINLTTAVCNKIKAIPGIHLYTVQYEIDKNANTEGVLNPDKYRTSYSNTVKLSCNENLTWAVNNSLMTGPDYSTQLTNALISALTDSKVTTDFSNYQITSA